MRILFATTRHFLPQCVGGSEWSTHALCQGLTRAGDSVGIHCQIRDAGFLSIKNRIKRKLFSDPFPGDRVLGYSAFRGWTPLGGLHYSVGSFKPDILVIVGTAPKPTELAVEALRTGLPVVYQIRDVEFDKHGAEFHNLSSVRFVSNSNYTARKFEATFGYSSDVILPPVDPAACAVARPGKKVLLINPDPVKGGEIAIQLAEMRPDIPFIFQESWPSNAALHDLKARAAASGNVEWRTPVLDIRETYKDARILLAPSQWAEAWGRVATEAHISGIPVLGSACGGLEEAIGPGGLTLSYDAPIGEWLCALDRLWSEPATWTSFSKAALQYASRKEIDLNHQLDRFRAILLDTIATSNRRVG